MQGWWWRGQPCWLLPVGSCVRSCGGCLPSVASMRDHFSLLHATLHPPALPAHAHTADIVRVLKDVNLNVVSAEVDTVGFNAVDRFNLTYTGEPLPGGWVVRCSLAWLACLPLPRLLDHPHACVRLGSPSSSWLLEEHMSPGTLLLAHTHPALLPLLARCRADVPAGGQRPAVLPGPGGGGEGLERVVLSEGGAGGSSSPACVRSIIIAKLFSLEY